MYTYSKPFKWKLQVYVIGMESFQIGLQSGFPRFVILFLSNVIFGIKII